MTTEATGAPAAAETPSSVAGTALFGEPAAAAPAAAAPAAAEPAAALTPEQQAAADAEAAAKAAEAEVPAIKRPGKDATPEEWAEFYKAIGAPETAEAYEVSIPEGGNEAEIPLIQEMFKEAKILPEQAKALLDFRNKMFAEQTAAAAKAEEAAHEKMMSEGKAEHDALKNEWGANSDKNHEIARRGLQQFIPGDQKTHDKVIDALEKSIGTKETLKFWHRIGEAIGEHDAAGLGSNNEQRTSSKSTAEVLYPSTAGN